MEAPFLAFFFLYAPSPVPGHLLTFKEEVRSIVSKNAGGIIDLVHSD